MLVITRKKGESVLIGDDIEITIVNLEDGSAKIAISAPRRITILRKELLKEISDENKNAAHINKEILESLKLK